MSEIEDQILPALLELEQAVGSMAGASSKPDLLQLFARLDELARQLPPGSDPMLRHYLQNKSYQKARLLLQGRDAENQLGTCGR